MVHTYAVTFEDFKAAQRLLARVNPRRRFLMLLFYRILPVIGAAALIAFVHDVTVGHFSYPAWAGGALAGLAWLGLYPIARRPFQIRGLYKKYKNGRPEGSLIETEWVGDELISRVPMMSEGRFRRRSLQGFFEDERIAIVLLRKDIFLPIPKTAMSEEQWVELREWMRPVMETRQ